MTNKDYPYIIKWGALLGSLPYYVKDQVAQAKKDNAPQNAIYKKHEEETWVTTDDVTSIETRRQLGLK